ncbi:MAG: hypothetical protein WCL71_09420 [Deltaproteobacteria bacterium]
MIKQTLVLCAVLLTASTAWSAEKFGVAVYPAATDDAETTKIVKQLGDGACFKIITPLATVVDFYKKQPGLKLLVPPKGVESPATVFQKGQKLQVRIQSLPANPKETDFCISKAE